MLDFQLSSCMECAYRSDVAFQYSMQCQDQTKESVAFITSIIHVFFLETSQVLLTSSFEIYN